MTFDEFRASGNFVTDMARALPQDQWPDYPVKGWVYLNEFHIELVDEHWPEEARKEGHLYLRIANAERISDDLQSLEKDLYEYAESEGYFQPQ